MKAKSEAVSAKPAVPAKVVKSKGKSTKPQTSGNEWAEKYRPGTIGRQIAEAILAGKMTNDQILETVKKERKDAKTTYGCIAWYRSAARKAGILPK